MQGRDMGRGDIIFQATVAPSLFDCYPFIFL